MTNDLITQAREYLEKTENTPHLDKEWLAFTKNDVLIQEDVKRLYPIMPDMWESFLLTPTARRLIAELQKRLDFYEVRIQKLRMLSGDELEQAVSIMTEGE